MPPTPRRPAPPAPLPAARPAAPAAAPVARQPALRLPYGIGDAKYAILIRLHAEPPGTLNRKGQPRPDWANDPDAVNAAFDQLAAWTAGMPGARVTLGACASLVEGVRRHRPNALRDLTAGGHAVMAHDHADAAGYAALLPALRAVCPAAMPNFISGILLRDLPGLARLPSPVTIDGVANTPGHGASADTASVGLLAGYGVSLTDPYVQDAASRVKLWANGNGDVSQLDRVPEWLRSGTPVYQDGAEVGRLPFATHMVAMDFETLLGVSPPDTPELIASKVNGLLARPGVIAVSYATALDAWVTSGSRPYQFYAAKGKHAEGDNHFSDAGGTA